LKSGGSMAFAGLWESWKAPEGSRVLTCTIVTTAPNDFMAGIHNRMPVILAPELFDDWLEPHPVDPANLQPLLKACPSDWLEAFPVSTRVNKADSDGPVCVKPVELKPDAQGSLF
jgi:putative SOS response-associated peptidase YedK